MMELQIVELSERLAATEAQLVESQQECKARTCCIPAKHALRAGTSRKFVSSVGARYW
jgi:hypothetical protein